MLFVSKNPLTKKVSCHKRKLPIAWFGRIVENIQLSFKEIRRKQTGVYLLFPVIFKTFSLNLP